MEYKLIPLTQGKFALVDACDYDFLMQWKWKYNPSHPHSKSGYAMRNKNLGIIDGKRKWQVFRMHRVLMNPSVNMQVDHINGDSLDNRRENLRICNNRNNSYIQTKTNNTSSIYKGVSWKKQNNKWQAAIRSEKTIYLGLFESEEDAALAYNLAAIKYFGEFANFNKAAA